MTRATTKADSSLPQNETKGHLFDNWNDPLETEIRGRIRGFIEELIHEELDAALARPRYGRQAKNMQGFSGYCRRCGSPAWKPSAHADGHLRKG